MLTADMHEGAPGFSLTSLDTNKHLVGLLAVISRHELHVRLHHIARRNLTVLSAVDKHQGANRGK